MIDNSYSNREQNLNYTDRFAPQIRLYDKSLSQKDLSDMSINPEIIESFKDGNF